jgi:hypothetical protein
MKQIGYALSARAFVPREAIRNVLIVPNCKDVSNREIGSLSLQRLGVNLPDVDPVYVVELNPEVVFTNYLRRTQDALVKSIVLGEASMVKPHFSESLENIRSLEQRLEFAKESRVSVAMEVGDKAVHVRRWNTCPEGGYMDDAPKGFLNS